MDAAVWDRLERSAERAAEVERVWDELHDRTRVATTAHHLRPFDLIHTSWGLFEVLKVTVRVITVRVTYNGERAIDVSGRVCADDRLRDFTLLSHSRVERLIRPDEYPMPQVRR